MFLAVAAVLLFINTVSAKSLTANDGQTGDPDYTCSADKPCAIGCCGKNNICGMGPDYCSPDNCINSCDAKSECDPANWGPQYAASEKCPLNVRLITAFQAAQADSSETAGLLFQVRLLRYHRGVLWGHTDCES
jgi:hypothetical protein